MGTRLGDAPADSQLGRLDLAETQWMHIAVVETAHLGLV